MAVSILNFKEKVMSPANKLEMEKMTAIKMSQIFLGDEEISGKKYFITFNFIVLILFQVMKNLFNSKIKFIIYVSITINYNKYNV